MSFIIYDGLFIPIKGTYDRGRRPQLDFAKGKINPLRTLLTKETSYDTTKDNLCIIIQKQLTIHQIINGV